MLVFYVSSNLDWRGRAVMRAQGGLKRILNADPVPAFRANLVQTAERVE
jgi:hypothetical protein